MQGFEGLWSLGSLWLDKWGFPRIRDLCMGMPVRMILQLLEVY